MQLYESGNGTLLLFSRGDIHRHTNKINTIWCRQQEEEDTIRKQIKLGALKKRHAVVFKCNSCTVWGRVEKKKKRLWRNRFLCCCGAIDLDCVSQPEGQVQKGHQKGSVFREVEHTLRLYKRMLRAERNDENVSAGGVCTCTSPPPPAAAAVDRIKRFVLCSVGTERNAADDTLSSKC